MLSYISNKMKLITLFTLLSLPFLLVLGREAPTDLEIETTFKPDDCSEIANSGDTIKVHYVRL